MVSITIVADRISTPFQRSFTAHAHQGDQTA